MAESTTQSGTNTWLIILLLLLLLFGSLFAFASRINTTSTTTTTTTTTSSSKDCPGFDAQQEAFLLAQQAEQKRQAVPFAGNYANAFFLVCFTDTSRPSVRDGVRPVQGFYDKTNPVASWKTHSEQGVYTFLRLKMGGLGIDPAQILALDVVIFSQVRVCDPCQQSMINWQAGLRLAAKISNLYLSIWDLTFSAGFDPAQYPAGTGIPVTPLSVEEVPIPFR